VSFGEERSDTFLKEGEGTLDEGLSKTLESLRRRLLLLGACMESISMEF
jgi:hypothetical protein